MRITIHTTATESTNEQSRTYTELPIATSSMFTHGPCDPFTIVAHNGEVESACTVILHGPNGHLFIILLTGTANDIRTIFWNLYCNAYGVRQKTWVGEIYNTIADHLPKCLECEGQVDATGWCAARCCPTALTC
jgi:hypothetical protein